MGGKTVAQKTPLFTSISWRRNYRKVLKAVLELLERYPLRKYSLNINKKFYYILSVYYKITHFTGPIVNKWNLEKCGNLL